MTITKDTLTNLTTDELHNMILEMHTIINDISRQFETLFAHAKSLEFEKNALMEQLTIMMKEKLRNHYIDKTV